MKVKKKKTTIYKRLFSTYMLIIFFLIGSLDYYFINKFLKDNIDRNIYVNEKVAYDVNEEINKMNDSANKIIGNMYGDISVLEDILFFMSTDSISYLEGKMDKFTENKTHYFNGIERFVTISFSLNDNLEEVSFISYNSMEKKSFNRSNQIKTIEINKEDILRQEKTNNISSAENSISFTREIRDPINLESKGLLMLTYNFNYIKDVVKKYENKHAVIIYDNKKNVIYNSKENHGNNKRLNNNILANMEKDYYVNKFINPLGIVATALIPQSQVNKLPSALINSLILVDILLFVISLSIIYIKLKRLSDRTDKILFAMNEVKNGNLETKIPVTCDNDEISYISENFNKMCSDLNEYIKKIYLSQIEQKKAEMVALQNQINPHFLYNTLESIRMKAICNGDKEVGKMLYTLSFLFRKQVKDDSIITLKDELNYCRKYIEIFKFRYYDNFNFEINCPEKFEEYKIVKFSIQPIIENYFIHGIRLEEEDNLLTINVVKENDDILIKIIDNGKGIAKTSLDLINYKLKKGENIGDSIGISNVNERLMNEYGEGYGVELNQNYNKGITVGIKIAYKGV